LKIGASERRVDFQIIANHAVIFVRFFRRPVARSSLQFHPHALITINPTPLVFTIDWMRGKPNFLVGRF